MKTERYSVRSRQRNKLNPLNFKIMGMYSSHGIRAYKIPQNLYSYLLDVFGKCATGRAKSYPIVEETSQQKFFFYGNKWDYKDMLERTEFFRIDENIIL